MAATEPVEMERLGLDDIDALMDLVVEAGWNQTADDWRMMMAHGRCIGFREESGRPVASALALPMGERHGWISMVLVTGARRRGGLATRLMEDCVQWLEVQGIVPLLDATPAGAAVYERMGFESLLGLTRWQRGEGHTGAGSASAAATPDMAAVAECDAAVFGSTRRFVIENLASRGPAFATPDGKDFLLGRMGRIATQIGPVTAGDEKSAIALLDRALAAAEGPVFIDAFDAQGGFAEALAARGFTVQRRFSRMIRGAPEPAWDAERAFAAAGPELG